ncbi:MAG: DUF4266 domain-containing protein [Pseudomonadota bacterium]|nr:MAG: DUF4266 domain-containing protein [Pseudomonadota bacterium]
MSRTLLALLIGLLLLAGGCATEPWVAPFEREYLADPVMNFSRDPYSDAYIMHVYETREGAQGAGAGSGGGCGCN